MKKISITFLAVSLSAIIFAGCVQTSLSDGTETNTEETEKKQESTTESIIEETEISQENQDKDGYGAKGALADIGFTLEKMLEYAIQDEYLARQEYESIMKEYGEQRPFSNIIEAEEYHIELLAGLYEKYGIELPEDTALERVSVPESLDLAYEIGVQAEIDNIAMYDLFLAQDMPDDVRAVFIELRDASQNHLAAFEKGPRGGGNR